MRMNPNTMRLHNTVERTAYGIVLCFLDRHRTSSRSVGSSCYHHRYQMFVNVLIRSGSRGSQPTIRRDVLQQLNVGYLEYCSRAWTGDLRGTAILRPRVLAP